MALFNKLFQTYKWKNDNNENKPQSKQTKNPHQTSSLFPFSKDQVRVLIFRECDWTGRRLLFDSNAIQEVCVSSEERAAWTNFVKNQRQSNNSDQKEATTKKFIDICNGLGYVYAHTSNDSMSLGEMIFGAVAMSFKGTSLKVHWLQDPKQILCSQVFLSPIRSRNSTPRHGSSDESASSSRNTNCDTSDICLNITSTNSLSIPSSTDLKVNIIPSNSLTTNPLDVPSPSSSSSFHRSSHSFSGRDSGYSDVWSNASNTSYCHSMLSDSDVMNPRKLSIDSAVLIDATLNSHSSDGSMKRRVLRNVCTSLENHLSKNDCFGYFSENSMVTNQSNLSDLLCRNSSEQYECSDINLDTMDKRSKDGLKPPQSRNSGQSTTRSTKRQQRRSKIGLAVCIRFTESVEDEMQMFCSEHIALLESMLCRLRAAAEAAYSNPKNFYQLMLHAWFAAATWILDLFTAPRIPEPIWLSLSNGYSDQPKSLAKHFMTELCWLLNRADTKDTNFFFSTLLTAILTNHLGWVTTVAPVLESLPCTDNLAPSQRTKVSDIAKYHPYNVLWAQLGDLYGSVGQPIRLAKTIVCGAQTITINKVLRIITYFVRCGEIQRVRSKKTLNKHDIENVISSHIVGSKVGNNILRRGSGDGGGGVIDTPSIRQLVRTKTYQKDISTLSNGGDVNAVEPNEKLVIIHDTIINERKGKKGGEFDAAYEAIDISDRKNYKSDVNKNTNENHSKNVNRLIDEVNVRQPSVWVEKITSSRLQIDDKKIIDMSNNNMINDHNNDCIEHIDVDYNGNDDTNTIDNIDFKNSNDIKTDNNFSSITMMSATCPQLLHSKLNTTNPINSTGNSIPSTLALLTSQQMPSNDCKSNNGAQVSPYLDANPMAKQYSTKSDRSNSDLSEDNLKPSANVVFVLGDDDILSGLKPLPQTSAAINMRRDMTSGYTNKISNDVGASSHTSTTHKTQIKYPLTSQEPTTADVQASTSMASNSTDKLKKVCKKHSTHKKHSGVKFNFEQYPQIVTNYMKNKNLDITSYDFLEKGLKLEQENTLNYGASSASVLPISVPEDSVRESDEHVEDDDECECCANTFRILQTPSNATELEFSNDDATYPVPTSKTTDTPELVDRSKHSDNDRLVPIDSGDGATKERDDDLQSNRELNNKDALNFIAIPIPKTIFLDETKQRIRPGYVPSLFVGVTDHYIPDMVLQGITAPFPRWEPILKENLTLASHCATFEQVPIENVAIIANIDKWDVKLVSSHTYALSNGAVSGAAGMSQLVSTMLETVHAMWLAGSSAYQCMYYLESKLKEIYLQSKTLAAFLLATEFCSLQTVTTALSLSANDVPLLLSVASIHSPQVTKKYGISFR